MKKKRKEEREKKNKKKSSRDEDRAMETEMAEQRRDGERGRSRLKVRSALTFFLSSSVGLGQTVREWEKASTSNTHTLTHPQQGQKRHCLLCLSFSLDRGRPVLDALRGDCPAPCLERPSPCSFVHALDKHGHR